MPPSGPPGLRSCHVQEHARGVGRVLFVGEEMRRSSISTLPMNFSGQWHFSQVSCAGAEVLHRRRDRPVVVVERVGDQLVRAVELGLDKPLGAGADVTVRRNRRGRARRAGRSTNSGFIALWQTWPQNWTSTRSNGRSGSCRTRSA